MLRHAEAQRHAAPATENEQYGGRKQKAVTTDISGATSPAEKGWRAKSNQISTQVANSCRLEYGIVV
jgi:hypothetical protein